MLFENWKSSHFAFCIDPANVDLIRDFYDDKGKIKLLEIECAFSDEYLFGHAMRVGLATDKSPPETVARLMPTIRYDVKFESDRLADADFDHFHRIRETATRDENAHALAAFLDVSLDKARDILSIETLYMD
jgi:hypothetical protein